VNPLPPNNQTQAGQQCQPTPPPTPTLPSQKEAMSRLGLGVLSIVIGLIAFVASWLAVWLVFAIFHLDAPWWKIFATVTFTIFLLVIFDNVGGKKKNDDDRLRTAIGVAASLMLVLYLLIACIKQAEKEDNNKILAKIHLTYDGEDYKLPKTYKAGEVLEIKVKGDPCKVYFRNVEFKATGKMKIPIRTTGKVAISSTGESDVTVYR
jgi:hypothetical protein